MVNERRSTVRSLGARLTLLVLQAAVVIDIVATVIKYCAPTSNVSGLVVVSWQFLSFMFLITALGWWGFIGSAWRRNAVIRTLARAVLAVALTLTMAASAVNSYFSYLPTAGDVTAAVLQPPLPKATTVLSKAVPGAHPHGATLRLAVADRGSGFGRTNAAVWLPPQYFSEPTERFPVLYLFHGSPGMPMDWFRAGKAGQIASGLAARGNPVIVVAPQMSHSWLDDPECVDGIHERVQAHFLTDVLPAVDSTLRTEPDRAGRILAGMSAGGYCALNLGLRHPEIASTILDLSGFTVPTHTGGTRSLFGADFAAGTWANSPADYASLLRAGQSATRVWLDAGSEDHQVRAEMTALAPALRKDGFEVRETIRPGGHTYSVWRPALAASLRWALSPGVTPRSAPTR